MDNVDYLIIGAGIIGLTLARELIHREPDASILILEKETDLGAHGSGRNSGVLHSGIYYPEGSLKACMCADGARQMAEYCEENGLPFARLGKVIVPSRETDDPQLDVLFQRADRNGVRVEMLDEQQLRDIEPSARTATGKALFSPDTAVVDPLAVLRSLASKLNRKGVKIHYGEGVVEANADESRVYTKRGRYSYGWLFNCSGQFADRIAGLFGAGKNFTLLPFKGIYYRLSPESDVKCNGLIYPVPDLRMPFLGVHFTKKLDGSVYVGPTAVPALGREHYRGVKGIRPVEGTKILFRLAQQYAKNQQGFRRFTHEEASHFLPSRFARAARLLTPDLKETDLLKSNKVGIRAQLLDLQTGKLEMDFVVEKGDNSTHVLNAVSPAFTSSMSFAKYILDNNEV